LGVNGGDSLHGHLSFAGAFLLGPETHSILDLFTDLTVNTGISVNRTDSSLCA
jgi:hypothetical protein